jgi:hypothetical protein
MVGLQAVQAHLEMEAFGGPAGQFGGVILEQKTVGEDHHVGLVKLQEKIHHRGEIPIEHGLPAGKRENPAAQSKGLGGNVFDALGLKFRTTGGRGGEQAVAAGLVAAVGEVEPKFPQVRKRKDLVPAGVGEGGLSRQSFEEAPDPKVAVGGGLRPILQDPVAGGIGDKPLGPVAPHVDGQPVGLKPGPQLTLKIHGRKGPALWGDVLKKK